MVLTCLFRVWGLESEDRLACHNSATYQVMLTRLSKAIGVLGIGRAEEAVERSMDMPQAFGFGSWDRTRSKGFRAQGFEWLTVERYWWTIEAKERPLSTMSRSMRRIKRRSASTSTNTRRSICKAGYQGWAFEFRD